MSNKTWPQPPISDSTDTFSMKQWFQQVWNYFKDVVGVSSDNSLTVNNNLQVNGSETVTGSATIGPSLTVGTSLVNTLVVQSTNLAGANIKLIDSNSPTLPRWIRNTGGRVGVINSTYGGETASFYDDGSCVTSSYIQPAGGVYFPTAIGSGNANMLDAYQEGTWTPSFLTNGIACVVTYTSASGNYVRVGKVVYFSFVLGISTVTNTGSGQLFIAGLPFAAENNLASQGVMTVTESANWGSTTAPQVGRIVPNATNIEILTNNSADARSASAVTLPASALITNVSLFGAGFYFVNT